jgi:hypothetical protein
VTGAAGLTELVVGVMVSGHHCMLPGPWWEFLSERNRRVQPEELGVEEEVRRRWAALCSVRMTSSGTDRPQTLGGEAESSSSGEWRSSERERGRKIEERGVE